MSDHIITKKDVLYTAELAYLNVSEEQADTLTSEMEGIIGFANTLNEIDFDGFLPDNASRLQNIFRDDAVMNGNRRDEMLANAPKVKEVCYLVPRIVQ